MTPVPTADADQKPNVPPARPGTAQADLSANIGTKVGRSMIWMLGTSILIKGLSFVAQVAMGWYLSDDDFGVFALAFAIVGLCSFIREGGARDYLIQQGPGRYKELIGPLFWMAMTLTVILAVLLLCLAGVMKNLPALFPLSFRDPRLPWLLVLGAVMLCLSTPSSFTSAKLQVDMRFETLGKVQIGSGLVRYGTMIALAAAGFGPFAFLIAWIAVAAFELAAFRRVVGINLFAEPKKRHLWGGYIALTIWLAVGFFGNFLVEWGNSAAVGLFRPQAIVGHYYFAFGLTVQLVVLLSVNAQYVLMPALTRLNDQPQRQSQAILKTTRALVLVASGLCLGFSVAADSVMTVIWHTKWEPAVLAVQVFGVFFPMRMTYGLTLAIMQAKGQFKPWAITSVIEAGLLFAAAGLGAWYAPGAEWPALFVGVTLVFSRAWITGLVLKQAGIGARQRIAAQFPAWGLALLAAAVVWYADIAVVGIQGWSDLRGLTSGFGGLSPRWSDALAEMVRGASLGLAFGVLYAALIRVFMPGAVAEAVALAPRRLRGLAARLMFINLQPALTAEQAAAEVSQPN
ncbi:MAG TPA: oligosaccharide flippase family protein [Phycisphaerales bacterium]|nr:oligosaccharide flippase family protein [Phycisphaerales bacterium]